MVLICVAIERLGYMVGLASIRFALLFLSSCLSFSLANAISFAAYIPTSSKWLDRRHRVHCPFGMHKWFAPIVSELVSYNTLVRFRCSHHRLYHIGIFANTVINIIQYSRLDYGYIVHTPHTRHVYPSIQYSSHGQIYGQRYGKEYSKHPISPSFVGNSSGCVTVVAPTKTSEINWTPDQKSPYEILLMPTLLRTAFSLAILLHGIYLAMMTTAHCAAAGAFARKPKSVNQAKLKYVIKCGYLNFSPIWISADTTQFFFYLASASQIFGRRKKMRRWKLPIILSKWKFNCFRDRLDLLASMTGERLLLSGGSLHKPV